MFVIKMRWFTMCITAVGVLLLIKLRRPKGPAKRMQHHPTLLNPTLLDDVAQCWTRWPNECNMLDSTLGLERSGSKIYPESLENKRAPYWFAQKMARDRSTVKRCLAALFLLEMLEEDDDRVTKRGKTRQWIKRRGERQAIQLTVR